MIRSILIAACVLCAAGTVEARCRLVGHRQHRACSCPCKVAVTPVKTQAPLVAAKPIAGVPTPMPGPRVVTVPQAAPAPAQHAGVFSRLGCKLFGRCGR